MKHKIISSGVSEDNTPPANLPSRPGEWQPISTAPTEISPRERWLMERAAEAVDTYGSLDEWLSETIADNGGTVSDYLNWEANRMIEMRSAGEEQAND